MLPWLLLFACSTPDPSADPSADLSTALRTVDGTVARGDLTAAIGGLRVAIERDVTVRPTASGFEVVLHGRASDDLDGVFSFVPDDAFGRARRIGRRRFEVAITGGSELNTLLSGLPLLVAIDPTDPARPGLTAQVRLDPQLTDVVSQGIQLARSVDPVLRWDPNPLRYRVHARLPEGAGPLVAPAGVVGGAEGADRALDWTYDAMAAQAFVQRQPFTLAAVAADGSPLVASARFGMRVGGLALTDEDPYAVWPPPVCTLEVEACLDATAGPDVGACGGYREVQVCAWDEACWLVDAAPLALTAVDASALAAPAGAWDAACPSGGSWCGVDAPVAFEHPVCLDAAADVLDLLPLLAADPVLGQAWTWDPAWGTALDAAGLDQHLFFAADRPEGPALRAALDAWAGATDAVGWTTTHEIPCHNCHAFQEQLVVWYPSVGRVVVLTGESGYDS